MKKYLLILVVLLVVTMPVQAQFEFKLGPVTGLNFNIASGSDVTQTTNGFGFLIGAKMDMNFSSHIGLLTNVVFYDGRGLNSSTEGTANGINYTVESDYSIAYFTIEPLFKVRIPRTMFYFFAGPSVGFNIASTYEFSLTSDNDQLTFNDGSKSSKGTMKNMKTRLEIKGGSGMDIPIGDGIDISPEVSFGYGLTKISKEGNSRILTIQTMCSVKFTL
jgi:hypothetical protein